MFKQMLIKSAAVAVCLWYCLCIIGFDVHTCRLSERTFIVAMTSESDGCGGIHPEKSCGGIDADEDNCHHSSPVSSHDAQISQAVCCSDEFQQLDVTYARPADPSLEENGIMPIHVLSAYLAVPSIIPDFPANDPLAGIYLEEIPPQYGDIQSSYGIFRI